MKFGLNLEEGIEAKWKNWRPFAVRYDDMKYFLEENRHGDSPHSSAEDDDDGSRKGLKMFWSVYRESLVSMNEFYEEKLMECVNRLRDFKSIMKQVRLSILNHEEKKDDKASTKTPSHDELKQSLLEFKEDIELIIEFLEINKTACRKIVKKYDKRRSSQVLDIKMAQLHQTHSFLFGGGHIAEIKTKVESMLRKIESGRYSEQNALSSIPQYRPLPQRTLEKANSVLDEIGESPIFVSNAMRPNPIFKREEIEIGQLLGEGEFGTVHEIKAFHVKEVCPICFLFKETENLENSSLDGKKEKTRVPSLTCKSCDGEFNSVIMKSNSISNNADLAELENDHIDEAEELVSNRGFMKEHCWRKGSARYAIKEVRMSLEGTALADGAIDISIEAKLLSVISHPNIIKLCGMSKVNGVDPRTFIVLDRLYGTLGDKLITWRANIQSLTKGLLPSRRRKKEIDLLWNDRLLAMYDIARALKYLHSKELIYRDLKPENAGFDVRGNVKLFDFGLAKELQTKDLINVDQYKASGRTGTRRYMSPENALCKPYGKPTDVYSFGILLWEILALERPFNKLSHEAHAKEIIMNGKRPQIPKKWPVYIKTVISESWADDPSKRPDFQRICSILKGQLVEADYIVSNRTRHLLDTSLTTRELHC